MSKKNKSVLDNLAKMKRVDYAEEIEYSELEDVFSGWEESPMTSAFYRLGRDYMDKFNSFHMKGQSKR